MFQFAQTVAEKSARGRRGARGLSSGFGAPVDDLVGNNALTFSYQLANGHVVQLPVDWNSMPAGDKLTWIEQSGLSSQDAIQLETEAGISTTPVLTLGPGSAPAGLQDIPYTLANGHTVYLPYNYYQLSTSGKLQWIQQSNLSAQDSIQLETESGISSSPGLPASSGAPASMSAAPDLVQIGDVVRVTFSGGITGVGSTDQVLPTIAQRLPQYNLTYVNGAAPGWFSSTYTVDVQALIQIAHLQDVANSVGATTQGILSLSTLPSAAFVSKAAQTGGVVRAVPPGTTPAGTPGHALTSQDILKALGLGTATGAGGALLIGGALLVVILLSKK
jgi:hypothetical protein